MADVRPGPGIRRLPVFSGALRERPLIADLQLRAKLISEAVPNVTGSISSLRAAVYELALQQLMEAVVLGRELEGNAREIEAQPLAIVERADG
jgi:glycerate-2-kinase